MKPRLRRIVPTFELAAIAVALAVAAVLLDGSARAQNPSGQPIRTVAVRPGFYMLAGAGGNIAAQIGPDGIVLVDSGSDADADAVLAALTRLTDQPIRYIVNTSADLDHVGGNEKLARAGQSLFLAAGGGAGGNAGNASAISNGGAASIVGTENVLARMSAADPSRPRFPAVAWPTETFTRKQKTLYLNNEGIQILAQPAAHSDGDSIVFFRRSDVIATGDIFDITRFPVIDVERGGSVQGEIDALNRLIDLAIPSIPLPWKEGGTLIVPGHGRVCEQAELVEYRDMLTIVRDRVAEMIKNGMTLDQIKAASPTAGFTRRYGSDSGRWTTAMFIDAMYKSLTTRGR
jgi:cyclase